LGGGEEADLADNTRPTAALSPNESNWGVPGGGAAWDC
jgi:hypothetical protein